MTPYNFKVMPKRVSANHQKQYKVTSEQVKFYNENGYLIIKGLLDFTTLYACKQRFIQISKRQVDKGNITVVREPALKNSGKPEEDIINKLQEIAYDEVFATYIETPVLLDIIAQFIGDDISAIHSMFINKPPGTGRHPPHQDLYYMPFRPADKVIAAWTAVDDVTTENGCLWVIPGTHKHDVIYEHGNLPESNKLYHGILSENQVAPENIRQHMEMDPGDTIFFHPLLIHGSGPNVSKNYRKSISCHYANSNCHCVDAKGTVQEPVAIEIEEESKRRGFEGASFADVWIMKSKHVRGVKCNL